MRKATLAILLAVPMAQIGANPIWYYTIDYVKVDPPQIGLWLYYWPVDLSGSIIHTSSGPAMVNQGVIWQGDTLYSLFILDSTNTSGFVLNPEGDSVNIFLPDPSGFLYNPERWGFMGQTPSPISGHYLEWDYFYYDPNHPDYRIWILCPEFANPDYSFTKVVINEINAYCTWRPRGNFIELYNTAYDRAISLAGWKIVCDTILDLPDDAMIPPRGFYVISEVLFPPGFDMDFEADNLYLIDADSDIVDQVGWSSNHGFDVSFMRYPDGAVWNNIYDFMGFNDQSSRTFQDGFPTQHAPNRFDSPGFKVIGTWADTANAAIGLHWSDPVWTSEFDRSCLMRSTAGFPQTVFEGELVYEGQGQGFIDHNVAPGIIYYYTAFAHAGTGEYSVPDSESQVRASLGGVGIDDETLPEAAALLSCYPNPFNANTLIEYAIAEPGQVKLAIYGITGQKVAELVNSFQEAGTHNVTLNGEGLASGTYLVKLESGGMSRSVKIALLK